MGKELSQAPQNRKAWHRGPCAYACTFCPAVICPSVDGGDLWALGQPAGLESRASRALSLGPWAAWYQPARSEWGDTATWDFSLSLVLGVSVWIGARSGLLLGVAGPIQVDASSIPVWQLGAGVGRLQPCISQKHRAAGAKRAQQCFVPVSPVPCKTPVSPKLTSACPAGGPAQCLVACSTLGYEPGNGSFLDPHPDQQGQKL